jgi:hypothetical protein
MFAMVYWNYKASSCVRAQHKAFAVPVPKMIRTEQNVKKTCLESIPTIRQKFTDA